MSNPETLRGLIQHLRESTYWADSCCPHDPHFDAKNEGIREACDYLEREIADCTLDSPIIKRESKTCFDCDRYTTKREAIDCHVEIVDQMKKGIKVWDGWN